MTKFKILISFLLLLLFYVTTNAQTIKGRVVEIGDKKEKLAIAGATVVWIGTTHGIGTDSDGYFQISKSGISDQRLVVSFLGYKNDTIPVKKEDVYFEIVIVPSSTQLKGVVISENAGSYISKMDPRKVENITTGELYRAACCNLSESFETNASVDVSYSDAITGAKQIQMLGLSGIYSQLQTENIPLLRGMASTYGLNYIPGSWMESIQISKGTSSVVNGYESITGQINVEYKKPATSDKLFVNIYANEHQRMEANVNVAHNFSEKFSTMLMLHGDDFQNKINNVNTTQINSGGQKVTMPENFMDLPLLRTLSIFNRWDYINKGKYVSRFGIKYMKEDRTGGTIDFNKNTFELDTAKINAKTLPYGFGLKTERAEAFWKNGIMFANKPYKSIGLIVSAVSHNQSGFFGVNNYSGHEQSLYANLIYQSIINNTNHKFSTGFSYLYDKYREAYDQTQFRYIYQVATYLPGEAASMHDITSLYDYKRVKYNWDRTESVPGAFFEYTYTPSAKFTAIAGIRADYHNKYGAFVTPRINLKYKIDSTTIIRGSAGLGYRTANIIAENMSILASQRIIEVVGNLDQEKAINFGVNLSKSFKLFTRKAEFDVDVYRTNFMNQVVVDMDKDPTTVYFYNLDGKSYANSYQVQVSFDPFKRFTTLLAFRINDAKSSSDGIVQPKLLQNKYKGLVSLSYETKYDKWKFDLTTQIIGPARISPQSKMPEIVRRDYQTTPIYSLVNAQITRKFKYFSVYLGAENALNYKQKDPITEPFIPYHTHFDTTMAWGPIIGRTVYAGFRFSIK
ncbi:MAG: TonB-dependent receptor [Bacteroidota bacterium]